MKIIISPAKKMVTDNDTFNYESLPLFLEDTEKIKDTLLAMSDEELKKLWNCNDSIASLNIERLKSMDLKSNLTPAVLAYDGIQFKYMAPGVFTYDEFDYLKNHLRILSGFYGILKPFDGVTPYRLEMQAKLKAGDCSNLYSFWKDKLYNELYKDDDTVLNLASKEYSAAVSKYLKKGQKFITCTFGELKGEKVIEKGTECKMARGRMVRFACENRIENIEDFKKFGSPLYEFSKERSKEDNLVFIKK